MNDPVTIANKVVSEAYLYASDFWLGAEETVWVDTPVSNYDGSLFENTISNCIQLFGTEKLDIVDMGPNIRFRGYHVDAGYRVVIQVRMLKGWDWFVFNESHEVIEAFLTDEFIYFCELASTIELEEVTNVAERDSRLFEHPIPA